MNNPFTLNVYNSPEHFCDRVLESKQLVTALKNGRNTVLLSLRRMGKSSLIKHVFEQFGSNSHTIYFDIMNTNSVSDFVNQLAAAMATLEPNGSKRWLNQLLKLFSSFNPSITIDSITGQPSIELKLHSLKQEQASINQIFSYLETQAKPVYIAIDEFQQITQYADQSFVAFLRSRIQHLKNINFIFSGSEQHVLTHMFNSTSTPFYQSADFLHLNRIDKEIYAQFITDWFTKTKKSIQLEQVNEMLEWLEVYTHYVQSFFNKLWFVSSRTVQDADIEVVKQQIIMERDYIYSGIKKLITASQFELLKAIALSNGVKQPSSKKYISTFNLGTTSTVNSALKALIAKQLVYFEDDTYKVYDLFLAKWFQLIF